MRLTALQRFALHVGWASWQACAKRGCLVQDRGEHARMRLENELRARWLMRRGRP